MVPADEPAATTTSRRGQRFTAHTDSQRVEIPRFAEIEKGGGDHGFKYGRWTQRYIRLRERTYERTNVSRSPAVSVSVSVSVTVSVQFRVSATVYEKNLAWVWKPLHAAVVQKIIGIL